ncbi:SpoIIE family protein phosphatase [Aeromicrobium massiliense]|uniref:SpoIIE family protein phosphatase n=1 Tax=Aeromicrobium massiliense TaxID=1464554 RepID=UPI0003022A72|nr:SpoIIE family protein phosphatase [Aeromicrobium massiliense]
MPDRSWTDGPGFSDVDWAATPLGDPHRWSPALRHAVDFVVNTEYPATLFWGPQLVMVYNEAYTGMIGDKHPAALGASARDVFPEAWHIIGGVMEAVLAGEGPSYVENQLVPLERHGFLEDCYFTYSYSPVHGEDGAVEGVLDIAAETTREVVALRRLDVLTRLRSRLTEVEAADEVLPATVEVLLRAKADLPVVELRSSAAADPGRASVLPDVPPRPLSGTDLLVHEHDGGRVVWLPMRLGAADVDPPVLVARLADGLAPDDDYLDFLRLVATAAGQVRGRLEAREVERSIAQSERRLSEALQNSLLSAPRQPDHVQVAVRYRASEDQAEVGGDWYDSFVDARGRLTVGVGDVSGHDRLAAAGMAHARNMQRAIAYSLDVPPSQVVHHLDGALAGLDDGVLATAVLCRLEQAPEQSAASRWTLRWSNAGSIPPVLLRPSGDVEVLDEGADLMLGVDVEAPRTDHEREIEEGSVLVLCTDGLIERRGTSLTRSIERLARVVGHSVGVGAERLADRLLLELAEGADDDVVVLVLRVGRLD